MIFTNISLILFGACPPLFVYGLLKGKERLQYATALLFLFMLIDIFIGLNTPNPDKIKLIQVVIP